MDNPEKWNSEEKRLERKERLNSLKAKDGGKKPIRKTSKTLRILMPIVAVILILTAGIWATIYFAVPQKIFAPMTIGSNKVSSVEFSYYYANALNQLEIDKTTDAGKTQLAAKCTEVGFETVTWQDYAYDLAAKSIVEIQIQYDLAKAENMVLTDAEKKEVQDVFDGLVTQVGDKVAADKYLIEMFGNGVTVDTLQPVFEKQTLASKYAKDASAKVTVSDQEIADQYNKNKLTYDTVTFRLAFFEAETKTSATDAETATFTANAKAAAEAFLAKVTDEASFKKLAAEKTIADEKAAYDKKTAEEKTTADTAKTTEETAKAAKIATMTAEEKVAYEAGVANQDTSILRGLKKTNIDGASTDMGTWLFDAARKVGDKSAFSAQGGFYAIYFVELDAAKTLPTVRHILLSPNKDKDISTGAVFTAEEWTASRTKAQDLLKQCTSLDKFIELVSANTTDTASATTGGLYESVERNKMMPEFNDWCFETSRKPDDQAIVRTDYGFHIIRFIENKETTALSRNSAAIKTELAQTKYTTQMDAKKALPEYKYAISSLGIKIFSWGNKPAAEPTSAATASK